MPYDPRTDPKYKDNKLLLALTHQESRFNPNAVSPTGARGLTQVLPSTARSPGFGVAPSPQALTDPEANMAFGASYLDAMRRRYKGDNAAALVAYNGGPVAADRWVASGKDDSVISKESRNYYKSVLSKAGEGYDFSKVKVAAPKAVPTAADDSDEETTATTGFAKLRRPGTPDVAKPVEDSSDDEATGDDEEATKKPAKVKAAKASTKEDDEDDDEEDDAKGGKSSGFSFDAEAAVPKLKAFEPGRMFRPGAITLGSPKLQIAQLELIDDPKDR